MDALKYSSRIRVAGLIAVGLVTLVLLSSCAASPAVNVEATAQSLARAWVAQTAEAQSAAQAAPSATDTPVSAVTTPPATEIPAAASTVTSTVLPTLTVMPTRPTATTVAASPVPGLTPGPAAACPMAVDPQLAAGWDQTKLGCPTAKSSIIWSAWEPFQHGDMFWRSDIDWIYELHWENSTDAARGDWSTGKDAWKWDQSHPDGHGLTPPSGFFEPVRGFGYVWYEFLAGPDSAMGWATAQEMGFCASLQPFENGLIFHSSGQPCEAGMYNWAANPSFAPLFFTLYADGTWERH
jgi:hypothetical protein